MSSPRQFYYDDLSDDNMMDDQMEILSQQWVADAIKNTKDTDEQRQYTEAD